MMSPCLACLAVGSVARHYPFSVFQLHHFPSNYSPTARPLHFGLFPPGHPLTIPSVSSWEKLVSPRSMAFVSKPRSMADAMVAMEAAKK